MALSAYEYRKHSPFAGLTFLKIPQKVKSRAVKFRPYGRNAVRETKDKPNMKICKSVINKQENICVGVYLNDVGVLG
jgi:hypothetical protein